MRRQNFLKCWLISQSSFLDIISFVLHLVISGQDFTYHYPLNTLVEGDAQQDQPVDAHTAKNNLLFSMDCATYWEGRSCCSSLLPKCSMTKMNFWNNGAQCLKFSKQFVKIRTHFSVFESIKNDMKASAKNVKPVWVLYSQNITLASAALSIKLS